MSTANLPQVSVVVPAYNAALTLPSCLTALRSQTYPASAFELIVVDDGSTDDTAQVAVKYEADRVLRCVHGGPAAARNAGIAASCGEIILFTDADCEPLPDWIAEMVRPFADPAVVGVKGSYRTRQASIVARLAQYEFEERYDLLERQASIDFIDSYAAAFRTGALRALGGFDLAFPYPNNEDVDLSYRLAGRGHRLVFNRRAVVYHRHVDRWTAYLRLKVRRGYWRMMVYRLHPAKALRDSYTPQLMKGQVLLAGVGFCFAWLAVVPRWRRPALVGAASSLGGLLLSALPFTRLVARRDPPLWPWALLFVVARAAAFAAGVAGGAAGMLAFRRNSHGGPVESGPDG
jgi:glycosyltransferase involved in cell wall biosynthesis